MVINELVCCGSKAGGPDYRKPFVEVIADADSYNCESNQISIPVEAGFLKSSNGYDASKHQFAAPTCSQTFTWLETEGLVLEFTSEFQLKNRKTGESKSELCLDISYISLTYESAIAQKFATLLGDNLASITDKCPLQNGLSKTTNPYYYDPQRKKNPVQSSLNGLQIEPQSSIGPVAASSWQSNTGIGNLIISR